MQPALPLELQLQILELAIPPLTRKNLPHLRELMRTWPLVSRAWKVWAYAKVPIVPKLVLSDAETDRATLDRFLAAVADSGRLVKRFEVDVGEWTGAEVSLDKLIAVLQEGKELWITLPWNDHAWPLELPGLHRIDMDEIAINFREVLIYVTPRRLKHLTLRNVVVPHMEAGFPQVETLLLIGCWLYDDVPTLFERFPALRVLALHRTGEIANDLLLAWGASYSATLQHLLMADCDGQAFEDSPDPPMTFPPTLKTITFRYSSVANSNNWCVADLLHEACAGSTTAVTVVVYDKADPLETDFDVEAWALSVGA